jgi:hypothetical protein
VGGAVDEGAGTHRSQGGGGAQGRAVAQLIRLDRLLWCDTAVLAVLAIVVVLMEIAVLAVLAASGWLSCQFKSVDFFGFLAPHT